MTRQTNGLYLGRLDTTLAGRLLRRAVGYCHPADRDALVGLQLPEAWQRLLAGTNPGPRWGDIPQLEIRTAEGGQIPSYRTWQLARVVESPQPLKEIMTLFWVDLFGVSALRVQDLRLFHEFRMGLLERALASLAEIFQFALTHPAFLLNLRAANNYRAQPQEQIGRFVVRYLMEDDPQQQTALKKDIARAYTGLFIAGGKLRFYAYEHDSGPKRVGEQSGDLNAEGVATALAKDPAVVRTVIRRLFRWLVSSAEPPPEDLRQTAEAALLSGKPLGEVLPLILGWEECLATTRFCRVKSPLEVYLAVARPLGCRVTLRVAESLAELGWDVIHPPTLAGWPYGGAWLTGEQLSRRLSFIQGVLSGQENWGGPLSFSGLSSGDWASSILESLLDGDLPPEVKREWDQLAERVRQGNVTRQEAILFLTSLPQFQIT